MDLPVIAVVGATGLVGRTMIDVICERGLLSPSLILTASDKSAGKEVRMGGINLKLKTLAQTLALQPKYALFSAGGDVSREWAPRFAEAGTTVIDNSSAWRMHVDVPLIVPEVNAHLITDTPSIIANPNCSTIQLVMVLAPLHAHFGLEKVVVSTYQAVSGTGMKGIEQLEREEENVMDGSSSPYAHPIYRNCIPHCDSFEDNGYTKEEMKLMNESRKILAMPTLPVTATSVRVPVTGGHSESVSIWLHKEFSLEEVRQVLANAPGVVIQDNPTSNSYPMPLYAQGKDEVFVGRLRKDLSDQKQLNLWIVGDNLRKGAATNAVQILEACLRKTGVRH